MISTKATNTQAEMTFNPSEQHVSNRTCKPYMVGTYFSEDVKKCHFNNGASEQNAGISKQYLSPMFKNAFSNGTVRSVRIEYTDCFVASFL